MNDLTKALPSDGPPPAREASQDSSEEGQSRPATGEAGSPSLVERLAGLFRSRNGSTSREDLEDALAGAEQSFSPGERAMLHNILRLREKRVEDVMVPRADIEAVEISTALGPVLSLFEQSGHSRMPVFFQSLDDPRGMIHIRDVVAHLTRTSRSDAGDATDRLDLGKVDLERPIGELEIVRPVLFVPPSMLASDLMTRMQADRIQMALVIDEYGGTDGLVSLEDVVEIVVGDIEDEHDEEEPLITQTGEGIFLVDARAEIDEVAERVGGGFSAGEHGEDVDTIAGLIFSALGRVPLRGEVVQAVPGFEFHVLDADPRRIKRVRIVSTGVAEARRRLRPQG